MMQTLRRTFKGVRLGIAAFILMATLLAVATPAVAHSSGLYNWYGSNFSFDTTLTGSTRYYDLNNIGCDFRSYTNKNSEIKTFNLTLYRKNTIGSTKLETKTLQRNGDSSPDWYNTGKGNYYFFFSKAFDGVTVKSDAMGMYSWQ